MAAGCAGWGGKYPEGAAGSLPAEMSQYVGSQPGARSAVEGVLNQRNPLLIYTIYSSSVGMLLKCNQTFRFLFLFLCSE